MRTLARWGAVWGVVMALIAMHATGQTLTWTGAGDGTTFGQAQNWSPVTTPGPTHDCVIGNGTNRINLQANSQVRSISTGRPLFMDGCGRVTFTAGLTLLNGAVITIENTGGCGGLTFQSGPQSIAGNGSIVITSAGNLTNNGAAISLQGAATVEVGSGISILYNTSVYGDSAPIRLAAGTTLVHRGLVTMANTSSRTLFFEGEGTLDNQGRLVVTSGKLRLNSKWTNNGSLEVSGSGELELAGEFSSIGTVIRTDGTVAIAGRYTGAVLEASAATGNLLLRNAELVQTTIRSSGGATWRTTGPVLARGCTIDTDIENRCGQWTVIDGLTINAGRTFRITSNCQVFLFTSGVQTLGGPGRIEHTPGAGAATIIEARGDADVTIAAALTIASGSDTGRADAKFIVNDNAKLTNLGTMDHRGAYSSVVIEGTGRFKNAGSIRAATNVGLMLGSTWTNEGVVYLDEANGVLGGVYADFGDIRRTGGSLVLRGQHTGGIIRATAQTGDLWIENLTAVGSRFEAEPGRAIEVREKPVFIGCTIATNVAVRYCNRVFIQGGLTFANNAVLSINRDDFCSGLCLTFNGGDQEIGGVGSIEVRRLGAVITVESDTTVTIGSGVRFIIQGSGSRLITEVGCKFVNLGSMSVDTVGAELNIEGHSFENRGTIECSAGSFRLLSGAWSNLGLIRAKGTGYVVFASSYSSIGLIERSENGYFSVQGNFTGSVLEAPSGVGTLGICATNLTGVTLRSGTGSKFVASCGGTTLTACTIDGELELTDNAAVTVQGGLTLAEGSRVTIGSTRDNAQATLTFSGGTQTLAGSGEILFDNATGYASLDCGASTTLTIAPGIRISNTASGLGTRPAIVGANLNSKIIHQGTITARRGNGSLEVRGYTSGAFENEGICEALAGTLKIAPTSFRNNGTLRIRGTATLALDGTYDSVGTIDRTGGTVSLNGTYTGASISTTSVGGDLSLGNITLNGTRIEGVAPAKVYIRGTPYLNACTIAAEVIHDACGSANISGGLTLDAGILAFRPDSPCFSPGSSYSFTGNQTIGGSGSIRLLRGTLFFSNTVTIGPGVDVSLGPTGGGDGFMTALSGATVQSFAAVTASIPGSSLSIGGSGAFVNNGSLRAVAGTLNVLSLSGPIGDVSISPGAALFLAGNYTIDRVLNVPTGARLNLAGTWLNTSSIVADAGTLELLGTWTNNGSITVTNSNWTIGGTYSSLGNTSGSNNRMTYSGSYLGTSLVADSATGDITLSGVSLTNVALRASDGARFILADGTRQTLKGCTVDAHLTLNACTGITFVDNNTLLNGSTITLTGSCAFDGITLSGFNKVLGGSGAIIFDRSVSGTVMRLQSGAAITIGSGIDLIYPATAAGARLSVSLESGSVLTNSGRIITRRSGGVLAFGGQGRVSNKGLLSLEGGGLEVAATGGLGNVTMATGSSLLVSGTYSIDRPLMIPGGASVQLGGTWNNSSTITAQNATVIFLGTWTNVGTLNFNATAWTIGGTYSSFGAITGGSNSWTIAGTYSGALLRADASTGDIALAQCTLSGTRLEAADGAKFRFTNQALVSLSSATLATDLSVGPCATLSVRSGLTLANGATIRLSNTACGSGLQFSGSAQTVSGVGRILFDQGGSSGGVSVSGSVTFGPNIAIGFAPDSVSTAPVTMTVTSPAAVVVQGLLASDRPGRSLTVSGSGSISNLGVLRAAGGTLTVNPTSITQFVSGTTLQSGRWEAIGSTLSLGNRAVTSLGANASIQLDAPGAAMPFLSTLATNAGTLTIANASLGISPPQGTFTQSGILELGIGGVLSVTGSTTFGPAATLRTSIGSSAPGGYGQLTSTGLLNLAGSLRGRFVPPLLPVPGDLFAGALSATSISGQFASSCFDSNAAGLGVRPVLRADNTAIDLVAEPSAGAAPGIVVQPVDAIADPDVTFTVVAGPSDVSYQWFRGDNPLTDGTTPGGSAFSGTQTPQLTITNATAMDAGLYRCRVSNSCGSTQTRWTLLQVCRGDINNDAIVDDADFSIFVVAYNLVDCAEPSMPVTCPSDLDRNGLVDDADFVIFVAGYSAVVCP